MQHLLTADELAFLYRVGLSADDVMDVRGRSSAYWKPRMREEDKVIALGTRCRSKGHRLRTRAGHCAQCDTSKIAYVRRHSQTLYVYIAGSLTGRVIKVGCTGDCERRMEKLKWDNYGGFGDWVLLACVKVKDAGEIESKVRSRFGHRRASGTYVKDYVEQYAIEMLRCSFDEVFAALEDVEAGEGITNLWKSPLGAQYNFSD